MPITSRIMILLHTFIAFVILFVMFRSLFLLIIPLLGIVVLFYREEKDNV